jgi:hypothetical protein
MSSDSDQNSKIVKLALKLEKVAEDVERLKKQVTIFHNQLLQVRSELMKRKENIEQLIGKKVVTAEQGEELKRQRTELMGALNSILERSLVWMLSNRAALDRLNEYEDKHNPEQLQKEQGNLTDEQYLYLLTKFEKEWIPLCNNFLITRNGLIAFERELKALKHKIDESIN